MGKYSDIITEIQTRLVAATGSGKVLDGYTVLPEPIDRVEGQRTFPAVAVQGIDTSENYDGSPAVKAAIDVAVMVATSRSAGCAAYATACERVMDAIETAADGTADPALNGLSAEHMEFEMQAQQVSALSLSGVVVVTVQSVPFGRKTRAS